MSSPPSQPPAGPSAKEITQLLAPIYLGGLFTWFLFGVSAVQLYLYHVAPYGDRKIIQASVYIIFVLDVFQSLVGLDAGWGLLISGWGQPSALTYSGWTFAAMPAVTGIVAAWVQTFYAWRIHKLSQSIVLPVGIVILALVQMSAAFSVAVGATPLKDVRGLHNFTARLIVWFGGSALVDLIISITMAYLLINTRKTTRFKHSERKINKLIRLSVETGFATTTVAICDLITFLAAVNANYHTFFTYIMCKVYANALLSSLNAREVSSQQSQGRAATLMNVSSQSTASNYPTGFESSGVTATVVHMTHDTEVFHPTGADTDKQAYRGDIELVLCATTDTQNKEKVPVAR